MANYTRQELKNILTNAGIPEQHHDTFIAIAFAESSGNAKAHNKKRPDDSYGLWQINMIDNLGPDRRKRFGLSSNEDLFDPITNAKVAWEISNKGRSFKDWTTFTSGKYKDFLTTDSVGGAGQIALDSQSGQMLEVTKKMISRAALVDPEIQKILRDFKNSGAQGQEAEDALELAIENSKWARGVSDRVRATVGTTIMMDEPTYQETRKKEVERIKSLATIYGAEFDEATLNNLADNTLLLGWSDEELRDALIGTVGFGPAYVKGLAGTTSQRLIQGIRDNGFDMSTSSPEFINYVKESIRLGGPDSAAGKSYLNDTIGNFRNQAAQLYPQFRNRFEQGANLSDVLSPYRTAAASMLEVPFESIGLQDDLMKQVLQSGDTLNLFDFGKMVRKSPAWQYTSNAWDTILGTLEGVLEDFGFKF